MLHENDVVGKMIEFYTEFLMSDIFGCKISLNSPNIFKFHFLQGYQFNFIAKFTLDRVPIWQVYHCIMISLCSKTNRRKWANLSKKGYHYRKNYGMSWNYIPQRKVVDVCIARWSAQKTLWAWCSSYTRVVHPISSGRLGYHATFSAAAPVLSTTGCFFC